jgi:hypothetical protein
MTQKHQQPTWLKDITRQIHLDMHIPGWPSHALSELEPAAMLKEFQKARVNFITLFAKDHFGLSYYDTKVGKRHPKLNHDFLATLSYLCREAGICTTAYYSLNCDEHIGLNYPDWCQVDKDDQTIILDVTEHSGFWRCVCMNTGYWDEYVFPQLEEIIKGDYSVDGFWFDIPSLNSCFCQHCQRLYKQLMGQPLEPVHDLNSRKAYMKFNALCYDMRLLELRTYLNKHRPDWIISGNRIHGFGERWPGSQFYDLDCIESELWHYPYAVSTKARCLRTGDRPFQSMNVRFSHDWGEMTLKEEVQLKLEVSQAQANGGLVCLGDQVLTNGRLEGAVYDRLHNVFTFVEERESFLKDSTPVKEIAIIPPYLNEYSEQFDVHLQGCAKALIESKVQFDVLEPGRVDKVKDYKLAVVPAHRLLTEAEATTLRNFVAEGGTLLATLYEEDPGWVGKHQDLFGVQLLGPAPFWASYLGLSEPLSQDIVNMPLLAHDVFYRVLPNTAETWASLIYPETETTPARSYRHPMAPAGKTSEFSAITAHTYGKGRAVLVGGPLFKSYFQHNYPPLRKLICNLLERLQPSPPYRVKGPVTLEANLMQREKELHLHLINSAFQQATSASQRKGEEYSSPTMIEEIPPLFNIAIEIKTPQQPTQVLWQPEGSQLSFTYQDGYVETTIPKLEVHGIVQVIL